MDERRFRLPYGPAVPLLFAASLLVAPASTHAQRGAPASRLVGPMVGHVEPTEATIWAYAGANAPLSLRYGIVGSPQKLRVSVEMTGSQSAENHHAARVTLTGLQPATPYTYEVLLLGKTRPTWRGRFTTAPPPGAPVRFKMAVSSCMHPKKQPVQPSWFLMLAEKPAFHLLLGDNVYADSTDREVLWTHHLEQRRVVEFAALIRNLPTYAMWDDHDYGPNNSDGKAAGKENALRAFGELFANPGAGTPHTPGAFYRFAWGDVDFFILDGRYYRSPNTDPDGNRKRMLGDAQFAWLVDGLEKSTARFKVLASGSTLQASKADGWRLFSFARRRLFEAIMQKKIGGVLYLSGDIHECRLEVHPPSVTRGYPLYEVISSGIANSPTRGFATLEFDTTRDDPTVRVRIIHGDTTVPLDRTIPLSRLQLK